MKLFFHPGTNMAQAMAETINYVNRSRAFMPPGTVSPFVMRFDTGSVPVGYLVLSSETRTLAEIQDLALFRVRPMFATLPGVSAPPPFGGNQRTVVVNVDPDRLRAYHVSPEEVIAAVASGNTISPSGNVHVGDMYPIVPLNSIVGKIEELGQHSHAHRRGAGHLSARPGHDSGQFRHSHRICAGQRPAGDLSAGHQAGRCVDVERRQRGQECAAQDAGRAARRHPRQLRVRSIAVRDAGDLGAGHRGLAGRGP